MRSGIVAVWDQDREYAMQLASYLSEQDPLGDCVIPYMEPDKLMQAVETHQISLAVAGEPMAEKLSGTGTPVVTLAERKSEAPAAAYKYQPAGEILRIIYRAKDYLADLSAGEYRPTAHIRAIYAPLGGCLKTSLGLVMGNLLAEDTRCLFLSLEAHAGFRTMFERQYPMDLSDLLALVRHGGDLQKGVADSLQSFGKLQYIPPVIWPEDIRESEVEELKELLRFLAGCGRFDEIVLDVGQDLARPEEVLTWCDRIYRPEKSDAFSLAKLAEYDSYLKVSGYESLLTRTKRIPLSQLSVHLSLQAFNQWQRWEEMVPAVRQLLMEEREEDPYG